MYVKNKQTTTTHTHTKLKAEEDKLMLINFILVNLLPLVYVTEQERVHL